MQKYWDWITYFETALSPTHSAPEIHPKPGSSFPLSLCSALAQAYTVFSFGLLYNLWTEMAPLPKISSYFSTLKPKDFPEK